MAAGEIVGAAVGVLLLVIVAYILVGSTLSTAEIVASAQKDLTIQNEARLRTNIVIPNKSLEADAINFSVQNTGNEMISDFAHMDILSSDSVTGGTFQYYTYDSTKAGIPGTWYINRFDPADNIHPNILDPGETIWCIAKFSGNTPKWLQVTTANGVYASGYIP